MAAIDSIAEVEVLRVADTDSDVVLIVSLAICTVHDSLDISCAIAIVSDVGCNLCTIHSCEPCTPVCLTTAWSACVIACAPTIIVGTNHSIFGCCIFAVENDDEVVPVVGTACVVSEDRNISLARSHLDIVRVSTPEACRVVGSTYHAVELIDYLKLSSTYDRLAKLALVALVIYSDESLLAHCLHIWHNLEYEISSSDSLGYFLLELNLGSHIGKCLFEWSTYKNLLCNATELHAERQLILTRSETADRLDSCSEEVDERSFRNEESTYVSV